MKQAKLLPLLLSLCLLCGCAMARQSAEQSAADTYSLYFTTDPSTAMGRDAVASASVRIEGSQAMDTHTLATTLIQHLLDGPEDLSLRTPFPNGTTLLSLQADGSKATVDLSAAYSTLSGIQLTLADYCMTLTLTQLPEISVVSITVQGQELAYRDRQNFLARDVLLSSTEDVVGTVDAELWFLDPAQGQLVAEPRTLELYEGDTQAGALLDALLAGPSGKKLTPALPADFSVLSVWTEDSICYVNLPSAVWESAGAEASQTVKVLVDSLCSLDSISGVQIRVDGESRDQLGDMPISGILQPQA